MTEPAIPEQDRATLNRLRDDLTQGRPVSAEELLPLLYDELRSLARSRLAREGVGHSLQPTALVHEAFLRLVGERDPGWNGRGHFFGAAATAMRRILVERARSKGRLKRGGDRLRVDLDVVEPSVEPPADQVLAVEEVLERLEAKDARKGKIVELRYFAGLTVPETAAVLEVSVGTVEREWRFVKAWLQVELEGP